MFRDSEKSAKEKNLLPKYQHVILNSRDFETWLAHKETNGKCSKAWNKIEIELKTIKQQAMNRNVSIFFKYLNSKKWKKLQSVMPVW